MLSPCVPNIIGNIYFRRSVSYILFIYSISYNAKHRPRAKTFVVRADTVRKRTKAGESLPTAGRSEAGDC